MIVPETKNEDNACVGKRYFYGLFSEIAINNLIKLRFSDII